MTELPNLPARKSVHYFLSPTGDDASVSFVDNVNALTLLTVGDEILRPTVADVIADETARGMPEGYQYDIYRVTVEKVEQTV